MLAVTCGPISMSFYKISWDQRQGYAFGGCCSLPVRTGVLFGSWMNEAIPRYGEGALLFTL
jgi:hypothetical protein